MVIIEVLKYSINTYFGPYIASAKQLQVTGLI